MRLLLEAIYLKHGFDFREYADGSLRRRMRNARSRLGFSTYLDMQREVVRNPHFLPLLLEHLTVPTTEMFRDPEFFKGLREKVVPILRTYPSLKIWHAGCSTGEEVYAMSILLHEEGLAERSLIYATDISHAALAKAKEGIYPIDQIRKYTSNYQRSGGQHSFSEYYHSAYDSVVMDRSLRRNVVFSDHNLASDKAFAEANLIMCRNVMIYFNQELKDRVFKLFLESLCIGGFLCLGSKESVRFSQHSGAFSDFDSSLKIYRKNVLEAV